MVASSWQFGFLIAFVSVFVVFGLVLAYRYSLGLISQFFLLLQGLTTVISPIYFWTNSHMYSKEPGLQTVKNFSFSLEEFLTPLTHSLVLWFSVSFSAIIYLMFLRRLGFQILGGRSALNFTHYLRKKKLLTSGSSRQHSLFDILIFVSVFCIFIPLLITMFHKRIGIIGIQSPRLPYHFSGILYYFRTYLLPIIMSYLYFRSSRNWVLALTIFSLTIVAGITSSSRMLTIVLGSILVALDWIDKKWVRSCLFGFLILIFIQFISDARSFIYTDVDNRNSNLLLSYKKTLLQTDVLSSFSKIPFTLGGIINRIQSTQDLVLAEQVVLLNPSDRLTSFFGGGRSLVDDLLGKVYGFKTNGSFFVPGVHFTLLNSFIVLSLKNHLFLCCLGFFLSLILTLTDLIFSVKTKENLSKFIRFPLAFFTSLSLFWAEFEQFFLSIAIFLMICATDALVSVIRKKINGARKVPVAADPIKC